MVISGLDFPQQKIIEFWLCLDILGKGFVKEIDFQIPIAKGQSVVSSHGFWITKYENLYFYFLLLSYCPIVLLTHFKWN